ncbi:DUF676-domain-containing protein [Lepidopterella palustris CBS 459.81]|uniref:DUF676-domain-containing protein n=1 Tax=Lepidopterella palustris CBS 459.81 TaxID=1314670 RepID=A0A8E2E769_9PEZI|nr:DUF676-domain-containing protein [Lepidopterella palustris CBS 459.81]
MLLVHQVGSVKVGEVVRYTLTYTPSADRILPSPSNLHVKIKNTSAIPLRAAYLHGPYNIHVATYPSAFNPNRKLESPKKQGVPEFEPNLKAGGSWNAKLTVPEDIREIGGKTSLKRNADGELKSATWIIEVASQIVFSNSASVDFELLVARDERSLDLGFAAITGNNHGTPGHVEDHQEGKRRHISHHAGQPKGVYSKAVRLVVEDTESLWNKPALPKWDHKDDPKRQSRDCHLGRAIEDHKDAKPRKPKKIHLVILTHGLHSNLGADMLYLKESIDATAKQAREDRRNRKAAAKRVASGNSVNAEDMSKASSSSAEDAGVSTTPLSGAQEELAEKQDDSDDEEVIVRGFNGNSVLTEKGIQYLGKRMAKYVLEITYPDQPFLPIKKSVTKRLSNTFSSKDYRPEEGVPAHAGSSIHQRDSQEERAYKFTSISFIGHSLGGLVQTYAIAYIFKHSPHFFDNIKPISFITMASPFLGLSNENPMYVKFALDFGLVGRTGQDLGLTWRAPTIARSGWTALVGGLGNAAQKEHRQEDPGAKPLLRILPTGPAHIVLRKFRNRTVYSNVVNDGIVPLRTSCLLFLDWRGLGRVQKARRENGLIGTVAGWGWGQLTGQNTSQNPAGLALADDEIDGLDSPSYNGDDMKVPQPGEDVTNEDDKARAAAEPQAHQFLDGHVHPPEEEPSTPKASESTSTFSTFFNFLRPGSHTSQDRKMFRRSQTRQIAEAESSSSALESEPGSASDNDQPLKRPPATRGDSVMDDPTNDLAPPKTTIFESAGDLLSPPVPPTSWIIDPSTRSRTIFHDRVYHPEDIPPPPAKRPGRFSRSLSSEGVSYGSHNSEPSGEESGGMRVEEKIARAYHHELSWRKVLVRLEPDAHNNIVVRRMFANAYGWPVIKHLCDTHFGDTYSAVTRDEHEPAVDRAKAIDKPVEVDGEEVNGQSDGFLDRTNSEMREVADNLTPLKTDLSQGQTHADSGSSLKSRDSSVWDDSYFDGTSDDDDDDEPNDRNPFQRFLQLQTPKYNRKTSGQSPSYERAPLGTSHAEIADFLTKSPPPIEGHRGLGYYPRDADSLESMHGRHQTSSPPDSPPVLGNTAELGLRRSLELPSLTGDQYGRRRSGSGGVSEQVARLSVAKDWDRA